VTASRGPSDGAGDAVAPARSGRRRGAPERRAGVGRARGRPV